MPMITYPAGEIRHLQSKTAAMPIREKPARSRAIDPTPQLISIVVRSRRENIDVSIHQHANSPHVTQRVFP